MKKYLIPIIALLYAIPNSNAQSRLYPNEFDLSDVVITDGPLKHAMDKNVEVLLSYDVDRLLAPYLKAAGLPPKAESFPNWDGLDGHIGGHYLSALAIHAASTGNKDIKLRLDYVLSQLAMCAVARGDGYIGGVPEGDRLWATLRNGEVSKVWDYWVPWYNVHKTFAGLRDAWVYTGSEVARKLFLGMCDWGIEVTDNLNENDMESMLDCEFGGMNEVFADAYAMTGNPNYLEAAKKFTHHRIFDAMSVKNDNLSGMHANTQVPKALGFQRIGELANDSSYYTAADFFWTTVTHNRSLSIGGNSRREHFPPESDIKSYVDEREGPETCNTNNMLKLTEGLFRQSPKAEYTDFYERALYNHILSSVHPEHGGYVYFTSARPAHYRVYSQPNCAMWCCVGTGMENPGKYAQFVYTHIGDSLQVNLYAPSSLKWHDRGVKLHQETEFPHDGKVKIVIDSATSNAFTLLLRHPGWCDNITLAINGKRQKIKSQPSSYIPLTRTWEAGDIVEIDMPMRVRLESLHGLPQYVSILRGPLVLASRYDNGQTLPGLIADDSRWGHIANGPLVSVFDTPVLIGNRKTLEKKLNSLQAVPDKDYAYAISGIFNDKYESIILEPFYRIHDSRYMLYWLSMTDQEYKSYLQEARLDEERRLDLDARTVDAVNTGEQQPEADHFMQANNSESGNFNGEAWRGANGKNSYFSYRMRTEGESDLRLRLRLAGSKTRSGISIFIDEQPIANIGNNTNHGESLFCEEEYSIPSELLDGKDQVTVKFANDGECINGNIFHVRLVKPEN